MKYRADVDGLRALAVVPVVLFHAGLEIFSGGYVGVDVFFVISGFVITSHILDELDAGRFSLLGFYERRIRRLMPAAFVTAAVTTVVAALVFMPSLLLAYSKSLLAMVTFVSNIYFWKTSGYFDSSSHLKPLLHTWSLAVEEQFYLFMPIGMMLISRFLKRHWRIPLALAALVSFALSVFLTTKGPTANFYLLPPRAWELLLGALIARVEIPTSAPRWTNDALAAAGLVLLAVPIFTYSEATPFPGASALAPCFAAAALIVAGTGAGSRISDLVGALPLRFIGRISYSFYLVHWPLIVFFWYETLRAPRLWESLALFAASFVLAVLSWKFVENPFRQRSGSRKARAFAYAAAAAGIVAFSGVAGAGVVSRGLQAVRPGATIETASSHGEWLEGVCFLKDQQKPSAWAFDRCVRTHAGKDYVMLWGDSFAAQYVPGILANADQIGANVVQYTAAGCPPSLNMVSYSKPNCHAFNEHAFEVIRDHGIRAVILSGRWKHMSESNLQGVVETVDRLHAAGVQVYLIGQSPEFSTEVQIIGYRKADGGTAPVAAWPIDFDPGFNQSFKTRAQVAKFIDPLPTFCQGQVCEYRRDGNYLFMDFGHLSPFGSTYAVRRYFPRFGDGSSPPMAPSPSQRQASLE